ncbi:MAG: PqqD family protein [Acidimicrobiales bacterium]
MSPSVEAPCLARATALVWRHVHDGVLVRPLDGRLLRLEGTGPALWSLLEQPLGFDLLVDALAEQYDAEHDTVAADLAPVIETLVAQGVLQWR